VLKKTKEMVDFKAKVDLKEEVLRTAEWMKTL
jgi:hypothetical protein